MNPASKHLWCASCVKYFIAHLFSLLSGHRKAVSYVRYLNGNELVSASTDSTLRLWETQSCVNTRVFNGHSNEKNFVGLSVSDDFISCGSETNEVTMHRTQLHVDHLMLFCVWCFIMDIRCLRLLLCTQCSNIPEVGCRKLHCRMTCNPSSAIRRLASCCCSGHY